MRLVFSFFFIAMSISDRVTILVVFCLVSEDWNRKSDCCLNFPFSSVSAKMTSQEATHLPALRIEDYQVRRLYTKVFKQTTLCIRDLIWWLDFLAKTYFAIAQLLQKCYLLQKWSKATHKSCFFFWGYKSKSLIHTIEF